MTEANGSNMILEELKEEIEELKDEVAEKTGAVAENAEANYGKMKEALEEKAAEIIESVKPYVEEGKQKTQQAVDEFGAGIKANPLASVGIAFLAGALLAKIFGGRE